MRRMVSLALALSLFSLDAVAHSRYEKKGGSLVENVLRSSTVEPSRYEVGTKKSGKTRVVNAYELPRPVSITGSVTLGDVISLLSQQGIEVKTVGDIPLTKSLSVSVKTSSVTELLDVVCKAADVWCDYSPTLGKLTVRATKIFTFSFFPEGSVRVSIGENEGGGYTGGGTESTSTGSSTSSGETANTGGGSSFFVYSNTNLNGFSFIEMLQEFFGKGVRFLPSPSGYVTVELTPSQWNFLNAYFVQDRERKEVVDVEVTLLRVDLNKNSQWGIDWDSLLYRKGRIHSVSFGFKAGVIEMGDKAFFQLATKSDPQVALITALSKYGKVFKVDSWHTQGLTGSIIPFGNYQKVKYFIVGSTSTDSGTETTATDKTVEVGFLGSLVVYKSDDGYYVDGAVNISEVLDWVTFNAEGVELKAPEVAGKKFRIATRLSSLDRTLVLGGFRISGFSSTEKAVPILHKIPVLGWLFKGKEDLSQNSEFVVLITLRRGREGITPEVEENIKKINAKLNLKIGG